MDWNSDKGIDLTSAFQGVTTPLRELYDEIHQRGWDVSKVDIKDGQYVATCKNPHGEKLEKSGPDPQTAVAHCLVGIMRQETMRFKGRLAAWQHTWEDQLPEIAQAYAKAPIYDPKAAGAWKELADDSTRRAKEIANQLRVEFTHDPFPYQDVNEMADDIKKKKRIQVSKANLSHPLWSNDQMLAYRLVHDVLGHATVGGDWGWHGENGATAAHMPLLSPEAQRALFTEAIGQTAHNHFYRQQGPQKVVFLDDHLEPVQQAENAPGHGGTHPSQTIVPSDIPTIPDEEEELRTAAVQQVDPNNGWESGVEPLPDNSYLWQREESGLDPLDHQGLKDAAHRIDTGWFNLNNHDGTPDLDSQRQAVVDAFRSTLLQPRKPSRWGATHYQHLRQIPATVSDPLRYADALDANREAHNQARGLPEGIHRQAWAPQREALKQWVKALNPNLNDTQVDETARRELFHMIAEEEERIAAEDPTHELSTMEIAHAVNKALKKRLTVATKPRIDQKFDFGTERLFHEAFNAPDPGSYSEFLHSHLRPVAGVSLNADRILGAAREDVANHGGKGHHFRSQVMNLIPGVGPKEISHAWLLLQPHTSDLGVINPSIAEALGYPPEEVGNRDYFKLERQLAAGRDAAGYTHVPLGQFGWGLGDYKGYGHGQHQDLRPFKAIDPTPYDQIDWNAYPGPPTAKWEDPYWWKSTEGARDEVGKQWDRAVAVNHPSDSIPFRTAKIAADTHSFETLWKRYTPVWPQFARKLADRARMYDFTREEAKRFIEDHKSSFKFDGVRKDFEEKFFEQFDKPHPFSKEAAIPWIIPEETGEILEGNPDSSLMQHAKDTLGLTTEQIWALDPEVGKR